MNRSIIGVLLSILCVLIVPQTAHADVYRSAKVTSYVVEYALDREGTVTAREQIVFDPGSNPQAPLKRTIPTGGEVGMVTHDGKKLPFTTNSDTSGVTVTFGEAGSVVTSTQKIVFTYVMHDTVTVNTKGLNHLELDALDDAFVYPVDEVTAVINLPREVAQRDIQFWCSKVYGGQTSACTKRLFRSVDNGNLVDALLGAISQMPEKAHMKLEVELPVTYIKHPTQTSIFFKRAEEYWVYELAGLLVIALLIGAVRSRKTPTEPAS